MIHLTAKNFGIEARHCRGPVVVMFYAIWCGKCAMMKPIVENAVKHGVGNKKGGGTIKISTYSDGDNIVLVVKDDGIGFEYNKSELENDDKKSHIGISSVTERIEIMVGGTVNIKSEANVGTTVTITIPKKIDEAKIDEYIGIR